ncbi:MAG: hypothetical protein GY835_04760, partial [bacterium]|nr:hypothetical protein [bacterium]
MPLSNPQIAVVLSEPTFDPLKLMSRCGVIDFLANSPCAGKAPLRLRHIACVEIRERPFLVNPQELDAIGVRLSFEEGLDLVKVREHILRASQILVDSDSLKQGVDLRLYISNFLGDLDRAVQQLERFFKATLIEPKGSMESPNLSFRSAIHFPFRPRAQRLDALECLVGPLQVSLESSGITKARQSQSVYPQVALENPCFIGWPLSPGGWLTIPWFLQDSPEVVSTALKKMNWVR